MPSTFTAFVGYDLLAHGDSARVARAAAEAARAGASRLLVFEDSTGRQVEVDGRTPEPTLAGLTAPTEPAARPGRGRPKLGVVPREVTLLPRHWDWLASQPGGASAALRRLVEDASRNATAADQARGSRNAVYTAMSALAGDLPGFEDAARALFTDSFEPAKLADWPEDVVDYLNRLAAAAKHEPPTELLQP